MQSTKTLGKYNILKTIGNGGSCKVKLAEDTSNNNKKVAIKIMNDNMGAEEKALLNNEITVMSKLSHQNIVKYLEFGQCDYVKPAKTKKVSFIALELAEGGELFDFVANTGRFTEAVARYYFKQLIDGL